MATFNVTLSATYTIEASSPDEAIALAKSEAVLDDFDPGYADVEEISED